MSTFLKSMGYLTMAAASVAGAGCSPEINAQGTDMTMTAKNEQSVALPRPPLKIPMPLDKAGYKIDVTFEVPPLPKGKTHFNYFLGLRVLFAPGTSNVRIALEENPVSARISLFRIEGSREIRLPLFSRTRRPAPDQPPRRGEVFEIPDGGEAIASRYYAQHSGAPRGTPDASTLVLGFASAHGDGVPGIYRLQVETLENIPALSGVTSFFVYEELAKR